jgi:undecaprenyl pyrophosphate synthase
MKILDRSTLQKLQKKVVDLTPVALYPIARTLTIEALKLGPIPKHISFIMDGNRRYSREQGISIQQGHFRGFESLKRVECPFDSFGPRIYFFRARMSLRLC